MKIVLGADHGGYRLKEHLRLALEKQGHSLLDVGVNTIFPNWRQRTEGASYNLLRQGFKGVATPSASHPPSLKLRRTRARQRSRDDGPSGRDLRIGKTGLTEVIVGYYMIDHVMHHLI